MSDTVTDGSPTQSEQPSRIQIRAIHDALETNDKAAITELTASLSTPDLADIIEFLEPADRVALVNISGPDFDFEVFSQLDETVRDQLSEELPNELLAQAVTELDSDDAAYLLESLEEQDRQEIFEQLPTGERAALERNFDYDEETAGRLMQSDFVAVPPFWTIGQVIDYLREAEDLPFTFSELFVIDPAYRVLGAVSLSALVRTKRHVTVEAIMTTDRRVVRADEDQEEVAREFRRYDLMSAPVVDSNDRMVGVVTVDDVVDVIQDEAEEDMKALAGVGDESIADSVYYTVRSRFPWLIVNLATAILASMVIQQFDATIEQMVSLAVLMPIVASMGGNAGTQTMTVTVRALATNKLSGVNAPKIITREAVVGLINGLLFAVILAGIAYVWFGSGTLGMVIAVAMVINHIAAGLAGILIPLAMDWAKLDPAPASGVFLTTITDVVGFFAFLGLASLLLM
ncbi:MAG: magnesium transporter [Pseudomonadota bacterium]